MINVENLQTYYIRYRYIPIDMMFSPLYLITIDHIQLKCKKEANEYDLKLEICKQLSSLNYNPDYIRIESSQCLNL